MYQRYYSHEVGTRGAALAGVRIDFEVDFWHHSLTGNDSLRALFEDAAVQAALSRGWKQARVLVQSSSPDAERFDTSSTPTDATVKRFGYPSQFAIKVKLLAAAAMVSLRTDGDGPEAIITASKVDRANNWSSYACGKPSWNDNFKAYSRPPFVVPRPEWRPTGDGRLVWWDGLNYQPRYKQDGPSFPYPAHMRVPEILREEDVSFGL